MLNQLLKLSWHSIIYGFGVVVSQVVGFFLIPVYTRYLTPSDYGTLEIFTTTSSILSIIFVMGLSSALFRSYFLHDDPEKKKAVVSTAFVYLSLTSAILSLLLIALASNFSHILFHSTEYTLYFRLIFISLFCDVGVVITLSVFRAREEPIRYALVTVARLLISISLNIVFVVVLHKGVLGILEANLITSGSLYVILLGTIIRRAGFNFSSEELKRMLAFGLPLVPAGLGSWILTLSDRYFLQFMSTSSELGLYSLGYKLGLVVNALVVGPFITAWSPFAFAVWKEKNAKQIYSRVFTYFFLVTMFIALVLSCLSNEVLGLMATPAFHGAYKVIPLIALSYVIYGSYEVLSVGIGLMAKTKYSALIVAIAAIVNLGLNYLLIPDFGMMGAAGATLASYLLLAISSYLVSRRFYTVDYDWGRVAKIFFAAAIVFSGSFFISDTYGVVHSYVIVGVFKLLALLTFPVLLYFFGFYQPEEIKKAKEIIKAAPGYVKRRLGNIRT